MSLKRVECEQPHQRVCQFYEQNEKKNRNLCVQYLAIEGIKRSTIYRMIKRFETNECSTYRMISGRFLSVLDEKRINPRKRFFNFYQSRCSETSSSSISFRQRYRKFWVLNLLHKLNDLIIKKINQKGVNQAQDSFITK